MKEAPIGLKSTLVETTLSLREIKQLRAGDVIAIDLPDLVTIEAEGTPVFRGKFGVYDGSRAVKVTQKVTPDQAEQ
jgi:flagellar motor switch protein FliM